MFIFPNRPGTGEVLLKKNISLALLFERGTLHHVVHRYKHLRSSPTANDEIPIIGSLVPLAGSSVLTP